MTKLGLLKSGKLMRLMDDRTWRPVVCSQHTLGYHYKQFVESSFSARYSKWDDDKAWSSQEWKADKSMDDRTVKPVVASWARTHEFRSSFSHEKTQHVTVKEEEPHDRTGQPVVYPSKRNKATSNSSPETTKAELELSVGSRSFGNRVNDQVRKRQKRISNVTEDGEKNIL